VPDAPAAAAWYNRAMGATELWNLGTVVGLEVEGASRFGRRQTLPEIHGSVIGTRRMGTKFA